MKCAGYRGDECSSAGLAKPLSCVSGDSASATSAWISFIFSLKAFLDVFEVLQADNQIQGSLNGWMKE